MESVYMTPEERRTQAESYLGKVVTIEIDRPIGYVHHKKNYDLIYPINYGYIPGVLGGDREELDVYLMGVDQPVERFDAEIVGIVFRTDDVEDKLVGVPRGMRPSKEEIAKAVAFQEQYHVSYVECIE